MDKKMSFGFKYTHWLLAILINFGFMKNTFSIFSTPPPPPPQMGTCTPLSHAHMPLHLKTNYLLIGLWMTLCTVMLSKFHIYIQYTIFTVVRYVSLCLFTINNTDSILPVQKTKLI